MVWNEYCKIALRGAGVLCLTWMLVGPWEVSGQPALGHRVNSSRITIETQDHWDHWVKPQHVLQVAPGGVVQPQFSRGVYDLIEEDLESFARSIEGPKIKKIEDRTITSVTRTFIRDDEGNLELEEQKIDKYLGVDFRRYPGNETYVVLDGELYAITDTSMIDAKNVRLTLREVDSDRRSTREYATKTKLEFPTYDYSVRMGISRAGSNMEDAANILDGNPETFWEPDLADTSDNWWVEIDLGRVVVLERVVLHFVDEERGDPFRQFRIMAAPDQEIFEAEDKNIGFSRIGGTVAPNTRERTFVYTPEENASFSQSRAHPDWSGRLVETIRIWVSDSKRFRARQISQEEWEALPADDRGDIVYYIRDEAGFEEPVDQEIYDSLGSERQGKKEYFIRERPRLSHVEVWGWGDNLSPGVLGKGGIVDLTGPYKATAGFDGDWKSNFLFLVWSPLKTRGVMNVDLGALIWLDIMRLSADRGTIDGYIVRASDGSRDAKGDFKWRTISPVERQHNLVEQYRHFSDIYDPPLKVRYLEMRIVSDTAGRQGGYNTGPWIGEMQLFSQGYAAQSTMTSDIVKMPGPRILGGIKWDPEPDMQPEDTEVEIRTRTGDLIVEQIRYFDSSGNVKTQKEWESLFSKYQGPIDTSFTMGGGWSSWSRKYIRSGERVTSPGLRNFMQFEVKFTTEDRFNTATLNSIEVELFDPVAKSVAGEIWPQQALPGRQDTFEVYLRPTFIDAPASARTSGFNEALLVAPTGVDLKLLSVSTGTEQEFSEGQGFQSFQQEVPGVFTNAVGDTLQVFRDGGDSLWVRSPFQIESADEELIPKVYNRITAEGDEVPVGQDGDILTEGAYGLLPEDERGRIAFFRQTANSQGNTVLEEVVDRFAYEDLPIEEQGPVRYFRKLIGAGAELPYDTQGNVLDQAGYNSLPRSARGSILGTGRLIKIRFTARVFLNGSTFKAFVRSTDPSADTGEEQLLWQQVDPDNATTLTEGEGLTIVVPVESKVIDDVVIAPNPFTPNGDGINDVLEVNFSVFRVMQEREVRMRVYTLDGRLIWEEDLMLSGGRHQFRWNGTDASGETVPPGLYLCQLHLGADWGESEGKTVTQPIALVY